MKNLFLTALMTVTVIACTGGGGGGASGSKYYTHSEVAQIFVDDLYFETYGSEDFEVVKYNTEQYGFIVVQDIYGYYYAIDIEGYNPEYDYASDYYYDPSTIVEPVSWEYGNTYYSPYYGYFEKTTATPKDLAKMNAIKEAVILNNKAEFLSSEFGLSMQRSKEVARLTHNWKKAGIKSMTAAEHDAFSTELLGFSISKGMETVKTGDVSGISALVEEAAVTNGITPEHASKLMTKIFNM